MDSSRSDYLSPLIPALKDGRFCSCSAEACDCGENFKEYEWVWDTESQDSDAVVLSCQNRETMFHPRSSEGTCAIRGTRPFQQGHVYYWEIKMLSRVYGTNFVVGVGTRNTQLSSEHYCSLVGNDKESWGYSYKGRRLHNGHEADYGQSYDKGSIIGVKLDMWTGSLEFYLNRKPLGVAFTVNKQADLFPLVSSTAAKSRMRMIHSTSQPANLMHHCLASLHDHYLATVQELGGIPGIKQFTQRAWWIFSDDEVLYPNNTRNKDYHWHLDSAHPEVSLHNLLLWNMKRQTPDTPTHRPWRIHPWV